MPSNELPDLGYCSALPDAEPDVTCSTLILSVTQDILEQPKMLRFFSIIKSLNPFKFKYIAKKAAM